MANEDEQRAAFYAQMEAEDRAWRRRQKRNLVLYSVSMGLSAGVFIVLVILTHWH